MSTTPANITADGTAKAFHLDALVDVWRAASRHVAFDETVEHVARLVAPYLPADVLVARRIDLAQSVLETVSVGACRPGARVPTEPRTVCVGRRLGDVLSWAGHGEVGWGSRRADAAVVEALLPGRWSGDALAVPLEGDRGPAAVLLALSSAPEVFADAHAAVLAALREPLAVALRNHWHLQELTRLRQALEADKQALLSRLERQDVSDSLVGAHSGLRLVMERVEQVAPTDAPVLVIGETGSGKEVVARAIHARSRRHDAPIVRVNCGAIPAGLVDSELFGHERGSFTGAVASRQGWFERADGGTLFLDEVGELPLDAQVRLLRILQDGTFERVGGQRPLTVDVRIVAATHRDLQDMIAQGRFREDLWYRIGVFPIRIPPLRERREDIPGLAAHFAQRAGHRLRGHTLVPSAADIERLLRYQWPGNVRELAAVIERAAILGDGRHLEVAAALGLASEAQLPAGAGGPAAPAAAPRPADTAEPGGLESLAAAMRRHAAAALAWTGGRVDGPEGAARLLRVNPHTLRARLRKLGVEPADCRAGAPTEPRAGSPPCSWNEAMAAHIELALSRTAGRIEGAHGAAALLRINPHTWRARMRRLGLDWSRYRTRGAPLTAAVLR
jgi:transcriptional regulator with GAF, ATPase, and Fis domain